MSLTSGAFFFTLHFSLSVFFFSRCFILQRMHSRKNNFLTTLQNLFSRFRYSFLFQWDLLCTTPWQCSKDILEKELPSSALRNSIFNLRHNRGRAISICRIL